MTDLVGQTDILRRNTRFLVEVDQAVVFAGTGFEHQIGQENITELQALGLVDRHDLHDVVLADETARFLAVHGFEHREIRNQIRDPVVFLLKIQHHLVQGIQVAALERIDLFHVKTPVVINPVGQFRQRVMFRVTAQFVHQFVQFAPVFFFDAEKFRMRRNGFKPDAEHRPAQYIQRVQGTVFHNQIQQRNHTGYRRVGKEPCFRGGEDGNVVVAQDLLE